MKHYIKPQIRERLLHVSIMAASTLEYTDEKGDNTEPILTKENSLFFDINSDEELSE